MPNDVIDVLVLTLPRIRTSPLLQRKRDNRDNDAVEEDLAGKKKKKPAYAHSLCICSK